MKKHNCATDDRKLAIDRPCSACSAGDSKMEYHDHCPPFREMVAPSRSMQVFADKKFPQEWRVEAIGPEGECFVVIFSGLNAEARAREYADWKAGAAPPSEREAAYQTWLNALPKCSESCEGDLEGTEHDTDCPLYPKGFATHEDAFLAGWQACAAVPAPPKP